MRTQYNPDLYDGKTSYEIATELVMAGYVQVSRRYGTVSRPDTDDVEGFLLGKGYHESVAKGSSGRSQYCRVYSQDWIEGVPDAVMQHVRKYGAVA